MKPIGKKRYQAKTSSTTTPGVSGRGFRDNDKAATISPTTKKVRVTFDKM